MRQQANASKVAITNIATRNACALCTALREYQNDLLKHLGPNECRRFCNTHGWMVANVTPAESAAAIFLGAIANPNWEPATQDGEQCDICRKMEEEKESRLKEITEQLRISGAHSRLHEHGMLCSRHGREVMTRMPEPLRETVQELLARTGGEVVEVLEDYLARVKCGTHAGGGVLGRAAEFLVAQRGIER